MAETTMVCKALAAIGFEPTTEPEAKTKPDKAAGATPIVFPCVLVPEISVVTKMK